MPSLVLVFAVVLVALLPAPASATGSGGVRVVTPTGGSSMSGDLRAVTLDVTDATPGTYRLSVTAQGGCRWVPGTSQCSASTDLEVAEGDTGTRTLQLPVAVARDGAYTATVSGPGGVTTSTFRLTDTWNDLQPWITFLTPEPGSTQNLRDDGDVVVILRHRDLPAEARQDFQVAYAGPNGSLGTETWAPKDYDNLGFYATEPGTYTVTVTGADGIVYNESTVTLVEPPTISRLVAVHSNEFFPLVDDGYQDEVKVNAWLREDARLRWVVLDEADRVLLDTGLGEVISRSSSSFTWDGRDQRGDLQPRGRYVLQVTSMTEDGQEETATLPLRISTEVRTLHRVVQRNGLATSSRSPNGCRTREHHKYGLIVDCPANRTACVTYRVTFPVGAEAGRWRYTYYRWQRDKSRIQGHSSVQGRTGTLDICIRGASQYSISSMRWNYTIERRY